MQPHVKLAIGVFVHVAEELQLCVPSVHSLVSTHVTPAFVVEYPLMQLHVKLPGVSAHVAVVEAQLCVPSEHSFTVRAVVMFANVAMRAVAPRRKSTRWVAAVVSGDSLDAWAVSTVSMYSVDSVVGVGNPCTVTGLRMEFSTSGEEIPVTKLSPSLFCTSIVGIVFWRDTNMPSEREVALLVEEPWEYWVVMAWMVGAVAKRPPTIRTM